MADLSFAEIYALGVEATDALLDRLAEAGRERIERRPSPRTWSAEEYLRHLVWLDDTLIRVESLERDPCVFPPGFIVLPGQVLENHFDLATTRSLIAEVRNDITTSLNGLTPELLSQTIEDSGGRTVAQNLVRYLERSAGARASASLVLRLVSAESSEPGCM